MSMFNKFKQGAPAGVNLEYSSFGQPSNTYQPPKPVYQPPEPKQKGKPRGGWGDDEDTPPKKTTNQAPNSVNFLHDSPVVKETQEVVILPPQPQNNIQMTRVTEYQKGQLLSYEELEVAGFEHEQNIINDAVKLGGIRLKQSDQVLKEFMTAVAHLPEQVIGSILLNRLHSEDNWKIQIRCIYAIQHSLQQNNYREFFKINQQYVSIQTDQQMLQTAIEATLQEINGNSGNKKEDLKFEFIEPPKPVNPNAPQKVKPSEMFKKQAQPIQKQQVPQQEVNLLDAFDHAPVQQQPPQQQPPQPEKKGFNFIKKQPNTAVEQNQVNQQPPQYQYQQPQQQQQPQWQQPKNNGAKTAYLPSDIDFNVNINLQAPPQIQNTQPQYNQQYTQPQYQPQSVQYQVPPQLQGNVQMKLQQPVPKNKDDLFNFL